MGKKTGFMGSKQRELQSPDTGSKPGNPSHIRAIQKSDWARIQSKVKTGKSNNKRLTTEKIHKYKH